MIVGIGVLNGGGRPTWDRLLTSLHKIQTVHDVFIVVLSQGSKGGLTDLSLPHGNIRHVDGPVPFDVINYREPVCFTRGMNDLLDYILPRKPDVVHFLDDDMEVVDGSYLDKLVAEAVRFGIAASEKGYFNAVRLVDEPVVEVGDVGNGCAAYRADLFPKVGYFDEARIRQYAADSHLHRRMHRAGAKIVVVRGHLVNHYNQTGTFNNYSGQEWAAVMREDCAVAYAPDDRLYVPRKYEPPWSR